MQVDIPRTIDEPPTVLLWTVDEAMPTLVGLLVGMALGNALIFTLAGVLATRFYRRYRDSRADGHLLHGLYRLGVISNKSRAFAEPFALRFIP
jgi:conjugal transfer pilus assembly protein TraL